MKKLIFVLSIVICLLYVLPVYAQGPTTDTYDINIIITNTNHISITTTQITTDTYETTGYIYINPFAAFDPIRIFASLMIFVLIGAVIKQPIWITLLWAVLLFTGIFNLGSVYWYYSAIMITVIYIFYQLLKQVQR